MHLIWQTSEERDDNDSRDAGLKCRSEVSNSLAKHSVREYVFYVFVQI